MDTTSNEHKWRILAALAGVIFMASLIFNSVAVVLPDIVREFRVNFATGQWVLLSYTLVQVSVMPIVGRLGDMLGKRPVFLAGTIAFMVTSILPGLAPTIELLILFRVLQAVGAAFAIALNYGIVIETFPPAERGKALGVFGAIFAAGSILGPMMGGFIFGALSWRWIFFVAQPFSLISLILAWRYLPASRPTGRQRFDWEGSFLLFTGLLTLMLCLTFGNRLGFRSPTILALFAVSIYSFWQFVRNEARVKEPLLDLSLFNSPQFNVNLSIRILTNITIGGLWFLFPFYLVDILLIEPLLAGLLLTAFWICFGVAVLVSGALTDRFGFRPVAGVGLAVLALGSYTVGTLNASSSALDFVLRRRTCSLGLWDLTFAYKQRGYGLRAARAARYCQRHQHDWTLSGTRRRRSRTGYPLGPPRAGQSRAGIQWRRHRGRTCCPDRGTPERLLRRLSPDRRHLGADRVGNAAFPYGVTPSTGCILGRSLNGIRSRLRRPAPSDRDTVPPATDA